ncbi:centrosome and spindle pole associated protein 1 [Biomphalaria glabrata]|nr:centrosome and spindle pole associated protein 1 [Biomphalaria glabrata]
MEQEPMHQGAKGRRKWGPPVDIESTRETEKENYKQLWHDLKGKYIEPSSNRQRWGSPVKLSPRGLLDTDALILDVQKEKERAEYEELWRRHHGMDPSPRAPINDRGAGNSEELEPTFDQSPRILNNKEKDEYRRLWEQQHPEVVKKPSPPKMYNRTKALDTAQIIREVEREKREEEELMKMKNPLLGGGGKQDYRQGNRGLTNGQTAGVNRDEYRKLWEEQHAKRDAVGVKGNIEDTRFEDSQKNIQDKIAEAKKEAEEYRKRWEAHHNKTGRPNSEPAIENVLPLGGYEANRKKLNEERQREYNEMLRQGKFKTRSNKSAPSSEPVVEDPLPLGVYEENRRKLNEERKREYREMLQKKKMGPKSQWVQPEEQGMIPFRSQEEKRKKLNEERRKEYNEMLQKHGPPAEKLDLTELGLAPEVDESEDFGLFHNLGAADKKLKEEKKDPPNQLNLLGQNIYDKTIRKGYQSRLQEQTDDHKTALLIANESDAMKLQKIKERNEEYNKFLANKAEKEQNRFADKKPAVSQDDGVYATIPGLRYSNSAQKREKEAERNREYNEMLRQKGGRRKGWGTPTYEELLERKRAQESQYRRANDIGYEPTGNLAENYPDNMSRNLLADDLNPNLGMSEQQKRKEEYKRDLQRQIAESAQARKAERELGLLVNNNGIINPEPAVVYYEPRPRRKDPAVEAYHTKIASDLNKLDDLSPRPTALLGLGGDRRNVGGFNLDINPNPSLQLGRSGILDLGFDAALNPARITSMNPPPGVQYQPSTYVTASTVPVMNSSVDEAYNFYATRNPLEPDLNVAPLGGGGVGRGRDVPSLNLNGIGGDGGPGSRVRFKEPREKSPPAMGMVFASDDEKKKGQRNAQAAYREELERQMMEKNIKKMKEKEEQERYDLKMEEEARTYDPFGKGGGGAPMRDQFGNVITDLRQIRNDNINRTENKYSPRDPSPYGGGGFGGVGGGFGGGGGGFGGGGGTAPGNTTRAANSYRDDLIGPPPVQTTAEGEASFARGGHGIFGMPKTEAEKVQADRYKIDLKRQIEEKRAEELRKKQLEKMDEEREQKLLEEQRAKMQREYDEEQRRLKEKEEDARRKNEEIIRAAEDKKRDMDKRRREAEEQRLLELRQERERERQMAPSPPVPAARHKQMDIEPAPSKQDFTPRAQSADVLNQLAQMRAQLQNERLRVQTMLDDQDDEVEIYDPRQGHRLPPPTSIPASRPEVDVFETAMNRNAVAVRRTPAGRRPSEDRAHPQLVEEFNALKHKNDSDSRQKFREMFPNEPETSDALETQQAALLRQQENKLQNLKGKRHINDTDSPYIARDVRSSSQLHSNSAFVDVNDFGSFPDDFEDMPRRNDSARYRRRTRAPPTPKVETPDIVSRATFGSRASLNVDKLAKKNEDRLRRLRELQGDDLSLYDPEDVLDRFMTKQGHNRLYGDDVDVRSDIFSPAFGSPVT